MEKFIPLIFGFNAGQNSVDGIRILFERLPLQVHRQYLHNKDNRVFDLPLRASGRCPSSLASGPFQSQNTRGCRRAECLGNDPCHFCLPNRV